MGIRDKFKSALNRIKGMLNKNPKLDKGKEEILPVRESASTINSFKEQLQQETKEWNCEMHSRDENIKHVLRENGVNMELYNNPKGKAVIEEIINEQLKMSNAENFKAGEYKIGLDVIAKELGDYSQDYYRGNSGNFEKLDLIIKSMVQKDGSLRISTEKPTQRGTEAKTKSISIDEKGKLIYFEQNSQIRNDNGVETIINSKTKHTYNDKGLEEMKQHSRSGVVNNHNNHVSTPIPMEGYTFTRNSDMVTGYMILTDNKEEIVAGRNVILNMEHPEELATNVSTDKIKEGNGKYEDGIIFHLTDEQKHEFEQVKSVLMQSACEKSPAFRKVAEKSGIREAEDNSRE